MADLVYAEKSSPLELVINEPRAMVYRGSGVEIGSVLPKASVSLAITSPPYPGVPRPEENYASFEDPMAFDNCHRFLASVWKACFDVLHDLGRLVINLYDIPRGEQGMLPNVARTIKECLQIGFVLREEYVWHKGASYSPPHGSWPYPGGVLSANTWEPLLVFQKPLQFSQRRKDPSDYPEPIRKQAELGTTEHAWLMDSVWSIPADRAAGEGRSLGHPFTFPLEVPQRFIRLYSWPGDTVFDPFLGSGTTVKAAEQLGRVGIGTEISDPYIEICKKRLQQGALF